MTPPSRLLLLLTPWLAGPAAAPGRAQSGAGAFAPGERWSHAAPAARPWIPTAVDLAADGELVWAAPDVSSPHLLLLAGPGRLRPEVVGVDRGPALHEGSYDVLGTRRADALFSLVQYPAPDALHRRTVVARHDPLRAGRFAPAWTHDLGPIVNAPARLAGSREGTVVVAAVHVPAAGEVQVDWIDGPSGALLERVRVPGAALRALSLSADGRRAGVSAGLDAYVLERGLATPRHREPLAAATDALALSGDGRTLAVGGFGEVRLLAEAPGGFVQTVRVPAAPGELAARAALSDRAETVAIGWWSYQGGTSLRFELRDGASGAPLFEHARANPPGGLQDFPQVVRVTPDGSRAALGSWGRGGAEPELLLVDRPTGAAVLQVDLPGSVLALALSDDGTRVAVAQKAAHANQLATQGSVRLFDTGERELQVLAAARLGGELRVAARRAGARRVVFLVGVPAALPDAVAGVTGSLLLERGALTAVALDASAAGRAELRLPVEDDPALLGQGLGVQAMFLTPSGPVLGERLAVPVVLP